jgi:valyl-tRNA synthetase
MVPYDEKTKQVVIEPYLTDQWFVNAEVLAQPALASVREGRTKFVPKQYENTYYAWMENIKPWCISRQLWWGHQIPAWYGPRNNTDPEFGKADALAEGVRRRRPRPRPQAGHGLLRPGRRGAHGRGSIPASYLQAYAAFETTQRDRLNAETWAQIKQTDPFAELRDSKVPLHRDEDVLDTWFSSALWPFSTLGWPHETPELKKYYPTDVLVTGFDIIFFWVARMMMMGLEFTGTEPFHTVYMHALVRDERGQKMSKTRGNVIDPLQADRHLRRRRDPLHHGGHGGAGPRHASRRLARRGLPQLRHQAVERGPIHGDERVSPHGRLRPEGQHAGAQPVDRQGDRPRRCGCYPRHRGLQVQRSCQRGLRLRLGHFLRLVSRAGQADPHRRRRGGQARDPGHRRLRARPDPQASYIPSCPSSPRSCGRRPAGSARSVTRLLILSEWPDLAGLEDAEADAEVTWLIDLVSGIRSVRTEMNVPAGARIPLAIIGAGQETGTRVESQLAALTRLARLESIDYASDVPKGSAQLVLGEATFALPLAGVIDLAAERARLEKDIGKTGRGDREDRPQAGQRTVRGQGTRGGHRGTAVTR